MPQRVDFINRLREHSALRTVKMFGRLVIPSPSRAYLMFRYMTLLQAGRVHGHHETEISG